MWYVLHCPSLKEETIIQSCKQHIRPDILQDAFLLTCDRMKRYQGSWHIDTVKIFPEYIFLASENPKQLSEELEQYRGFLKIMESEKMLVPVEEEEQKLLSALAGDEHHIAMSRGIIRDGVAKVTDGPLAGRESMIRKIDRHKRLAFIDGVGSGSGQGLRIGLEITEKS